MEWSLVCVCVCGVCVCACVCACVGECVCVCVAHHTVMRRYPLRCRTRARRAALIDHVSERPDVSDTTKLLKHTEKRTHKTLMLRKEAQNDAENNRRTIDR